jgi:hypothetical protein
MRKILLMFLTALFLTSCMFFKKEDKSTFVGPWAEHAENAWNYAKAKLNDKGIQVRNPSKLTTKFQNAEGTLGSGEDRFPYFIVNGQKLGGYLRGTCNGSAITVLAKEIAGWWNRNIGTHEVCHHVNNHALCGTEKNGHPNYLLGIAPHWPYWMGRDINLNIKTFHYQEGEEFVCFIYIDDTRGLTEVDLINTAKTLLELKL